LFQILTDKFPFHECKGEQQILLKISQHHLPADVEKLELHVELQRLLDACWKPTPKDRPGMGHCQGVLERVISLPGDGSLPTRWLKRPRDVDDIGGNGKKRLIVSDFTANFLSTLPIPEIRSR
jgi:hypothetical protein